MSYLKSIECAILSQANKEWREGYLWAADVLGSAGGVEIVEAELNKNAFMWFKKGAVNALFDYAIFGVCTRVIEA